MDPSIEDRRPTQQPAPGPARIPWNSPWFAAGVAGLLVIVALLVIKRYSSSLRRAESGTSARLDVPPVKLLQYTNDVRQIANGEVTVKARQHFTYRFKVEPEMYGALLVGEFKVSGGGSNDIVAAVVTEAENEKLISAQQAQVVWSTEGKQTAGRFQRLVPTGDLCLTFTNLYSPVDKRISLNFELRWQRKTP
ncbi:MAG TPA: hypothetical protein VM120_29285 [Bryobacteraceae bacterium]|nr:hypothetical protein [Bryobacteraceae bacterium]